MKITDLIFAVMAAASLMSGCSAALQSAASADDGMYGIHDKILIADKQRERAELQRAEAEARRAELEARIAQAQVRVLEDEYYYDYPAESYSSVLADSYESAYMRRLRGFSSPTYRLPSSYYDFRYGSAYDYVTAYDPAFYNVMVSGDQVWVEPKYISSMFGTWGATNVTMGLTLGAGSWYFGWHTPYYGYWWGFPHYSWYDWNWGVCYNPYAWWGYGWGPLCGPVWGPVWGSGGSWHGHHWAPRPHRENIVNRPPYTSPSTGKNFGSRPARGTINGSGIFRGEGSSVSRPSSGSYRYDYKAPNRTNNSGRGSFNGDRRGSSSFFNYDNNGSRTNRNDSNRNDRNSFDNDSYRSRGSSSGFSGGGFSGGSGSSSGGHRSGNSLGR